MESHAAGTYQWSGRPSVAGVFACAHPLPKLSPPFLSLSESLDEIRSCFRTPWRAPGDGSSSSFSRSFPPDSLRQTLAYGYLQDCDVTRQLEVRNDIEVTAARTSNLL